MITIRASVATCHLIWVSIYGQGVCIVGAPAVGDCVRHFGDVSIDTKRDSIFLPANFSRRGISCLTGEG